MKAFVKLLLNTVTATFILGAITSVEAAERALIIAPSKSALVNFAAGELQRYIYLRTRVLAEINGGSTIVCIFDYHGYMQIFKGITKIKN
jgi:hypothetical protein